MALFAISAIKIASDWIRTNAQRCTKCTAVSKRFAENTEKSSFFKWVLSERNSFVARAVQTTHKSWVTTIARWTGQSMWKIISSLEGTFNKVSNEFKQYFLIAIVHLHPQSRSGFYRWYKQVVNIFSQANLYQPQMCANTAILMSCHILHVSVPMIKVCHGMNYVPCNTKPKKTMLIYARCF